MPAETDVNRQRIADLIDNAPSVPDRVSIDDLTRVEVDCPDCKAPGGATMYRRRGTTDTPAQPPIAMECRVCHCFTDFTPPPSSASAPTESTLPSPEDPSGSPPTESDSSDSDPTPTPPPTLGELRTRAEEMISHNGAGWFTLSDGTTCDERGRDNAIAAQVLLLQRGEA